MIKTIIFDIGNVLMKFDYMPYVKRLLGDDDVIYRVNGAIWRSGYWNELDRGGDVGEIFQKMLAEEPEYKDEIRLAFENVGHCMFRMEYAIPWIQNLKARGYQVLFLSNYSHHTMDANPEVLDFLSYMDGGIFSCDVHLIKPDPAIYQAMCDQYTLKPEDCVFLDDNAANVISARAFGMNAILFSDYESAKAELETMLQSEDI